MYCLMKKIVSILFASAVAALALVSCQKETATSDVSNIKTVHFNANSIETKTAFGTLSGTTYPTLWTANDEFVSIFLNFAAPVNATVDPAADFKTASFSAAIDDDESGNYTFYAVSPSSAYLNGSISSSYKSLTVVIPTEQTPLAGSVDEAAQILVAKSAKVTEFPSTVDLTFKHFTAYGKFSLSNLALTSGETVSTISLTAEDAWANRWYYYLEDSSDPLYPAGSNKSHSASEKTIILHTNSVSDVWFACAPVDLGDKTIKVVVTTNKGTYTKTVTVPTGKKFESGKISTFTVNMSGVPCETPEVYKLTALTDITASDIFVIVGTLDSGAGNSFAMTNDKGTSAAPGVVSVTSKTEGGNTILSTSVADNMKWNLKVVSSGVYTFYPNGSTTTWLYSTNTNNGVRVGDSAAKGQDTWIMDSNGYLKNGSTEFNRWLGIYNSSDWRAYTNVTGNTKNEVFSFYVKQ